MNVYLSGLYDLHVHSAPDVVPRKFNDIELAFLYKKANFRAIVIKNHYVETAGRAKIASYSVAGLSVFGGIALNYSVGGVNPAAVEVCVKLGGRIIWMPTVDAENHRVKVGKDSGISVMYNGTLKREVFEVLEVMRGCNVILATGHLSWEEVRLLVREALHMGIEKIVVTHPEFWITRLSVEQQKELVRQGVYFERCLYSSTLDGNRRVSLEDIIQEIEQTDKGANTVISSDLGQAENDSPVEAIHGAIEFFLKSGLSENQIETMFVSNPRSLLG